MSVELPQTQRPVLNEQARSFVRRALSAGLVEIDDVKKVVMSMMSQSVNDEHAFVAERLAECLVHAGMLTQWQASKLLAGCGKGFYLGSYRLLRPLGKGGMGVVYLGEHHVMKRLVALKILPPEATNDARRISRFKEESVACGKLDHPNIVRAYDCDAVSGKLFIAIEYVDGIDLQRSVQRDGVMSIADALDMLRQATDGLAHAHERGIIHRDIKPANLILRSDGVLKVSDLGLARDGWSSTDGECRMMGTVDFIAPEQAINSQDAGTWSDIYSLGCTIYYLLTGRTPYDGTPRQRLAKHQAGAIPDVRETRSDCPAAIAELLMRMMAKKPEDRPKSAVELLSQVKRIGVVAGEPSGRHPRTIESVADTVMDEAVYQETLDDTSLSADDEVIPVVAEFDFDFSDLPPVNLGAQGATAVASPMHATPKKHANNRTVTSKQKKTASASGDSSTQQVLLGVGLALATLALVGVVGIGIYSFLKPNESIKPAVKSMEDGNVVIIQ